MADQFKKQTMVMYVECYLNGKACNDCTGYGDVSDGYDCGFKALMSPSIKARRLAKCARLINEVKWPT